MGFAGSTSGTLVEVESIDLAALQGLKQPSILLVNSATGDEEIAGYGDVIQAVILKQSLPHLSHLGEALMPSPPISACSYSPNFLSLILCPERM